MDEGLRRIETLCPAGFYYKDLTATLLTTVPWDTIAQVQDPLAFKMRAQQIGEVLRNLVDTGIGVASSCEALIEKETISGTVGDIQTRLRHGNESPLYLLIREHE